MLPLPIIYLLFSILPFSFSWGKLGHAVAIKLAFRYFSQHTKDQLRKLHMSEAQLVELSAWPDKVRYSNDIKKWGWTTKLHYVNLKSNERIHRYDPVRDSLSQPCIVDSIDYFSCAVTDQEEQIMKSQEALSFLTHNLADLHQPLHVCEKGTWLQYNFLMNSLDRIKERFLFWKKKNVDSWRYLRLPFSQRLAWDTLIVEQRVSKMKSLDEYVDYLEGLFPLINRPYADMIQRHTSSYLDMAVQWANETAQLNHIVWDVNSKDLKNGYSEQVGDVVDLQLARAGIRTAAVMNSLSEQVHVYQGPFLQSESIYPAFTQKALLALKATQEAKDNTQLSCLSFNE